MDRKSSRLGGLAIGAAALLLAAQASVAQDVPEPPDDPFMTGDVSLSKSYDEDVDVEVDNSVAVTIAKDSEVTKDFDVNGVVNITGNIEVSQAAVTVIDGKQILNNGRVAFSGSDASLSNLGVIDGSVLATANGNISLNLAVGDGIAQENAAAAAVTALATAASGDAEVFGLQEGLNNDISYGVVPGTVFNRAQVGGNVLAGASGNVGANVGVGAFHGQKNAIALAVVVGSASLAEATAGVLQQASFNRTTTNQTTNDVTLNGAVASGASGNVALNFAAGSNNLQHNALAITSVQ